MSKYLHRNSKGETLGIFYEQKIDNLLNDGAQLIGVPHGVQPNLVCVVDNTHFGAVFHVVSPREVDFLLKEDTREKTWLTYIHANP